MAAMESSTKNATEMLGKLTLSYNRQVHFKCKLPVIFSDIFCAWPVLRVDVYIYLNIYMPAWPCPPSLLTWLREAAFPDASLVCCRSRQASITTELIEIISGAAALEG